MTARAVVTGLGVMSPNGIGCDRFWTGLEEGRSGIAPITSFDASGLPARIAGEVEFDPTAHLAKRDIVRTHRFIHFALAAAQEAMEQARLPIGERNERMGVSIGTGLGGVPALMTAGETLRQEGAGSVSAYTMLGSLPHMAAGWVSMRTGARGPIAAPATACAAGTQAIGDALRAIQRGDADVMVSGGADALISPVAIAGFHALRALSTRNDDPTRASRPFDRDRDGFVLGEGAGILILENLAHARARRAEIYAEVVGFGLTADAYRPTTPSVGEGPRIGFGRGTALPHLAFAGCPIRAPDRSLLALCSRPGPLGRCQVK